MAGDSPDLFNKDNSVSHQRLNDCENVIATNTEEILRNIRHALNVKTMTR